MNESRGWEIYPKGIYDFGMKLKNDYPGLEFFVSENGMGVEREWELRYPATGEIADDYRIEFVREHLAWIARHRVRGRRNLVVRRHDAAGGHRGPRQHPRGHQRHR